MLVAAILLAICVTILLGFPIAGALALVSIGVMWFTSGSDLLLIFIQRAYATTTSFPACNTNPLTLPFAPLPTSNPSSSLPSP